MACDIRRDGDARSCSATLPPMSDALTTNTVNYDRYDIGARSSDSGQASSNGVAGFSH